MGSDLTKIPTNSKCSDHPAKSGRAMLFDENGWSVYW